MKAARTNRGTKLLDDLTRLRAQVEALRDSNASKADRLDRLGEQLVRLRKENEALRDVLLYSLDNQGRYKPSHRKTVDSALNAARAALKEAKE